MSDHRMELVTIARGDFDALKDEIARLRGGLNDVRVFLKNPEWGRWTYMEGSEVYGDIQNALDDIAHALGESA